MANFNNFNDIKIYIDTSISSAQLPDKIKGTVMYSAPFSPTSYTESITPVLGQIWFNTANNVYYEYNGSSWGTAGNIVPDIGDFLYVENYIETVNFSLDMSYPVKVLWAETLGSGVFEWKIIADKFYSPDNVTVNLNGMGKIQLATDLLRNLNSLSKSLSGHSEGVMVLSGSSDSISVVPSSNFLFSKGLQTLYSPDSGSGEVNTLNVKTLSGGSFKIGKDLSGTDPYFALDVETGAYNSPVRKFKLRTDQVNNEVVWEQPQQDSVLRQLIGNGVALITSGSSMYPSTNLGRNLGLSTNKFGVVYTGKLNNGQDLIVPNLAGTLARTQDIPSSLKNPNSLIIKLNSGTVEGTNLFTYDGSSAKTIDITPASIGASVSGHNHSQYLLKAGDFMTGDIYHNDTTRSVYSSGTGEANKQGEIKSTSTSLVVLAVSNLNLGAGTNKVVLRTGTPNDVDSTGSLVPELDTGTNLGSPIARWRKVFTDNLDANTNITIGGNSVATQTWVNSQLLLKLNAVAKGETASKTLSFGGTFKVLQTKEDGTVEERVMTMPANPDTNSNNYLTGVSGSGNGTVTFTRSGLSSLTWDASHSHSEYLLTTGKAADSDKLDGFHASYFYDKLGSGSDFVDGTLVTTDIDASAASGASWTIEVIGKGYGLTPFNFIAEGYNYNSTFINVAGYNYGAALSEIKVLKDANGKLAFWWARVGYWNSFDVRVTDTGGSGFRPNRVMSVTNSTEPASDKKLSISLVRVYSENNRPAFTGATSSANGISGFVPQPLTANDDDLKFLKGDGTWAYPPNTWNANSKDVAGYVAAPGAVANKVWKTDALGNPAWRDDYDSDSNTYLSSLAFATNTGVLTATLSNATTVTVNLDGRYAYSSHDHNILKEASAIDYGTPGLQWIDTSGIGGTGADGQQPENPYDDWFHHLIMNHANSGGFYTDIITAFHQDRIFFKKVQNGVHGDILELWHVGNLTKLSQLTNDPGYVTANNYLTGVSGSGNGTVTFTRNGLADLTWDASHTHSQYLLTAGKAADSDKLDGLDLNSTVTNNEVNKVMRTDGNGYANFGWINTTSGNTTDTVTDVYVNTNDGYIRKKTLALFKAELGSMPASDVYGWAKAVDKPSYTYSEVGAAAASHSHGWITSDGQVTSTVTVMNGDAILIADSSDTHKVKRGPVIGTGSTKFLREDGQWAAAAGAVTSVNGYAGAVHVSDIGNAGQTVNSVTYSRVYGLGSQHASKGHLRVATGVYAPIGSSSGNAISFGTTFIYPPVVMAFCIKAGSTSATVIAAKITAVTTTGATIISSYATGSTVAYTPAAETYGLIAILY